MGIFVTGGTGLVGSHLLYSLTSDGKKVSALIRDKRKIENVKRTFSFYSDNVEKLLSEITWVEGDLNDRLSIEEAICEGDLIYNCAAVISFNSKEQELIRNTNIYGTENLVDACLEKGVAKICHVSSIAALGKSLNGDPVTEDLVWDAEEKHSSYSVSKHYSEMEIRRAEAEGMPVVIVNPSMILGPGDLDSGSTQLFRIVQNGLKYYTLGINGYVDVRDVVSCMIQLMDSDIKGERFILSSENISYETLFKTIAKGLGVKEPSKYASPFMTGIAWRADKIMSFLTGRPHRLTRSSAESSHNRISFSNKKVVDAIHYRFRPVEESIMEICEKIRR